MHVVVYIILVAIDQSRRSTRSKNPPVCALDPSYTARTRAPFWRIQLDSGKQRYTNSPSNNETLFAYPLD